MEKFTKKLEPWKAGDVVSMKKQTVNYEVFLICHKETIVKKISNQKRSYCDGRDIPEKGARWCILLLFLLLYDGSRGKSGKYWSSPDTRVWMYTVDSNLLQNKVGVNSRISCLKMKTGRIVTLSEREVNKKLHHPSWDEDC